MKVQHLKNMCLKF